MRKKTVSTFPEHDPIHACVPHGHFSVPATGAGLLDDLTFAVKDIFDIAGHPSQPHVAAAMAELQGLCAFYKVLGAYPAGE